MQVSLKISHPADEDEGVAAAILQSGDESTPDDGRARVCTTKSSWRRRAQLHICRWSLESGSAAAERGSHHREIMGGPGSRRHQATPRAFRMNLIRIHRIRCEWRQAVRHDHPAVAAIEAASRGARWSGNPGDAKAGAQRPHGPR